MALVFVQFGLSVLWLTIGLIIGSRHRARVMRLEQKEQAKRCPCSHSLGAHKDRGRCQADVERYNDRGGYNEWVRCACTAYSGPLPIEDFYHPPLVISGDAE